MAWTRAASPCQVAAAAENLHRAEQLAASLSLISTQSLPVMWLTACASISHKAGPPIAAALRSPTHTHTHSAASFQVSAPAPGAASWRRAEGRDGVAHEKQCRGTLSSRCAYITVSEALKTTVACRAFLLVVQWQGPSIHHVPRVQKEGSAQHLCQASNDLCIKGVGAPTSDVPGCSSVACYAGSQSCPASS